MKLLVKQIEEKGLKVTHTNKRYLWVKSQNTIIRVDSYDLFGLEEDDLMICLKQKFCIYNIKIDLHNPDNNKSKIKNNRYIYISVNEKKEKIRELLINKYKLIS